MEWEGIALGMELVSLAWTRPTYPPLQWQV